MSPLNTSSEISRNVFNNNCVHIKSDEPPNGKDLQNLKMKHFIEFRNHILSAISRRENREYQCMNIPPNSCMQDNTRTCFMCRISVNLSSKPSKFSIYPIAVPGQNGKLYCCTECGEQQIRNYDSFSKWYRKQPSSKNTNYPTVWSIKSIFSQNVPEFI